MTDGAIAGTGNSRYLKSVSNFLTLYPTYADFVSALIAGTLPIDLNGINLPGWTTTGTPLNKANLLNDTTAAAINTLTGSTPGTVNEAIYKLTDFLTGRVQIHTGSYVGNGAYGASNPNSLTFDAPPVFIMMTTTHTTGYAFYTSLFSDLENSNILIDCSVLTTSYLQGLGFWSNDTNGGIDSYAKKSSDGKTVNWYNASSSGSPVYQMNASDTTYYYIAVVQEVS